MKICSPNSFIYIEIVDFGFFYIFEIMTYGGKHRKFSFSRDKLVHIQENINDVIKKSISDCVERQRQQLVAVQTMAEGVRHHD